MDAVIWESKPRSTRLNRSKARKSRTWLGLEVGNKNSIDDDTGVGNRLLTKHQCLLLPYSNGFHSVFSLLAFLLNMLYGFKYFSRKFYKTRVNAFYTLCSFFFAVFFFAFILSSYKIFPSGHELYYINDFTDNCFISTAYF